ncbi:K02291 crtB; 15-cis-phytoene synthase [Candidatus Pelagibacterales bacterium]
MKLEFYIKHYGKSFYWAGKFLKKDIFADCSILYAFCRIADDLVDNNKNSKSKINKFIKKYSNVKSKNIIINQFKKIQIKYNIPNKFINDLFYGIKLDTKTVKIKSKEEIIKYSYYVAGTVGAMMAHIFSTTHPKAIKHAIDLGIAMQLTNIARDVVTDAKLGRIYLPQKFFRQNIKVKDIVNENFDRSKLFAAITKIIIMSEKFYKSGNNGIKYLPRAIRFPIFLASSLYQRIGVKIINSNLNKYFNSRIYVGFFEKLFITLKTSFIFNFKY